MRHYVTLAARKLALDAIHNKSEFHICIQNTMTKFAKLDSLASAVTHTKLVLILLYVYRASSYKCK